MEKDPQSGIDERLASLEGRVTAMIEARRKRIRAAVGGSGYGGGASRRLEASREKLTEELDSLEAQLEALKKSERERERRSGEGGLRISSFREMAKQARRLTRTGGTDDFGLDRGFLETLQPLVDLLYERYFRVEAIGARTSVPAEGPAILVANRSGPIAYDALMIAEAVRRAHPSRRLRFQVDPFLGSAPVIGPLFVRVGGVKDVRGNALKVIEEGQLFLFFPEGFLGASKTIADRYRLAEMSGEFAEVALRQGVPVVPVAVLGAEEAQPVIGGLPLLPGLLGWPRFPMAATGVLPLPVKFRIHFGKRIAVPRSTTGSGFKARATALRKRTEGAIEAMLHDLVSARASVFLG